MDRHPLRQTPLHIVLPYLQYFQCCKRQTKVMDLDEEQAETDKELREQEPVTQDSPYLLPEDDFVKTIFKQTKKTEERVEKLRDYVAA